MTMNETIFTPLDSTLAQRVKAYYFVCKAYSELTHNQKQSQYADYTHYIGEAEQVAEAEKIIHYSLKQAQQSVSDEELKQAQEQGLLTQEQTMKIIEAQRLFTMSQKRNQSQIKTSNQQSIKH